MTETNDFSEALSRAPEQKDFPRPDQSTTLQFELHKVLLDCALHGVIDPVRMQNRLLSPGQLASYLAHKCFEILNAELQTQPVQEEGNLSQHDEVNRHLPMKATGSITKI